MLVNRSLAAAFLLNLVLLAGSALAATPAPARRPAARPAKTAHRALPAVAHAKPSAAAARPASVRLVNVTGLVLTNDGLPVPGASVYLSEDHRQLAVTNADGAFMLQVPARPNVQVVAQYGTQTNTLATINGQHPSPLFIAVDQK